MSPADSVPPPLAGPAPLACPVCGGPREKVFDATVLGRHRVDYFHCAGCGLLQTERPHWLAEAYASAITALDVDIVARNLANARRLSCLLYFVFDRRGRHLDFAGGYGLLTRMLRDVGFDARWTDPYCENLFAQGHEAEAPHDTASAFEVLEHVEDPVAMLQDLRERSGAGTLLLSTALYEGAPPAPDRWSYYALETGQHITFYQARTLRHIAGRLGLQFWTDGSLHMMTSRAVRPKAMALAAGKLSHLLQLYVRARMRSRTRDDEVMAAGRLAQPDERA